MKRQRVIRMTPVPPVPPAGELLQCEAALAAQGGLIGSLREEMEDLDRKWNQYNEEFTEFTEEKTDDEMGILLPDHPMVSLDRLKWGDSVILDLGTPWKVEIELWEDQERKVASFGVSFNGWKGMEVAEIDDFHEFATAVRRQLEGIRLLAARLRGWQMDYAEASERYRELRRGIEHRIGSANRELARLETGRLLLGLCLRSRGVTFPFRLTARREEAFEWLRVTAVNADRTIVEVTGQYQEALSKGPGYHRYATGRKLTITRHARVATLEYAFFGLIHAEVGYGWR